MTTPTADAIALAVKLSGHTHCQLECGRPSLAVCEACLGDAATIDRELQLPQRNAALLLAQGVVDAYERGGIGIVHVPISELRDALNDIKTPAMPHLQPTTTPLAPWPPKA